MAVFPESMNKLDLNDTTGSLARIENYINYMGERIEFAMTNVTRSVGEAGTSSVEVLQAVNKVLDEVSKVSSVVNRLAGEIVGTNNRIDKMQDNIEEMHGNITTLQESITDLAGRVEALEAGNGG